MHRVQKLKSKKKNLLSHPADSPIADREYERWRSKVEGKELMNEVFSTDPDNLFTMLFTNSKFFLDFHDERKSFGENYPVANVSRKYLIAIFLQI